ncbi:hypothetical protein JR316_0003176 [Psilocybe cubensis]|uniref:Uncharacterized protein n=1 Tax=Psilocybe cubensis TaxID=181762 RepID=A0ACB8H7E5_PSICU|nr:hypothetical protein JR316_0003176 [Psilocybe cubensis]KAH9483703.1 hypothetical protein JR316_0003176 [Psilocybe cubensis]
MTNSAAGPSSLSEVANRDPGAGGDAGFVVEDDESAICDPDTDQDSDYSNNTKGSKSYGKRKRAKRNKAPGQLPSVKKRRGTRGCLQDLLDMNVDVLHEIFGYLDPLDLLHLARTCKMTRKFLMSRKSWPIWKAARSNIIPKLPECPDDLSEPQYASLAFEKHCHFCLRNLKGIKTVWAARFRICTRCMDGRFLPIVGRVDRNRSGMEELISLRPRLLVSGILEQQWERDYEAAENKEKWLEKEIAKRKEILMHSIRCEMWYQNYEDCLLDQRIAMLCNRAKLVEDRLAQMGWEEEISHMRENNCSLISQNVFLMMACQKNLTESGEPLVFLNFVSANSSSVIQALLPILERTLESYRKERLTDILFDVLSSRIPILEELVDEYRSTIRPDAVALDIGDIFNHPEVLDFMINSKDLQDLSHLDPIRAKLPVILQQLQDGIEDELVTMVEASCGEKHGLERTALLSLATTVFDCGMCCDIRYPRILVHKGAYEPTVPFNLSVFSAELNKTPWNASGQITFNTWAHEILEEVVTLSGFDPATTSFSRMEEADPIFECHDCNNPHLGRFMLQWSAVAQLIRVRMGEVVARQRADYMYLGMACTRCHVKGNSVSLRTHVMSEHGISDPSEEAGDFVVALDSPDLRRTCWIG